MSIEAMKQALDYMQSDLAGRIKKKPHAISALRQAIEQAEKQEPVAIADGTFNHNCPIGSPLYTTPPVAQPAPTQEHQINQLEKFKNHVLANANALGVVLDAPAALVQEPWSDERAYHEGRAAYEASVGYFVEGYHPLFHELTEIERSGWVAKAAKRLYITPQPQCEWVGLTDEEFKDIWLDEKTTFEALKKVEAKLKEKNT